MANLLSKLVSTNLVELPLEVDWNYGETKNKRRANEHLS